jgi:hypothetical protein
MNKTSKSEIILFVGDVGEYLANAAHQQDILAKLITTQNCKNIRPGTYYTSIGDLITSSNFETVLKQSDVIIYTPPVVWNNDKDKIQTEYWLSIIRAFEYKKIVNADNVKFSLLDKFLNLADERKSDGPQIWMAGCSITHGSGVDNSQRYGQLIADQLQKPVSFLSATGSSISWASDQLLRSDIRKDDIVVWGLTSIYRMPWFEDNLNVRHIGSWCFDTDIVQPPVPVNQLWEQNRAYDAITKIHQVVNFCNKLGVKLYLAGILVDIRRYSLDLDNFIPFYSGIKENEHNQFLDIGTDPEHHPGPLTHRWYADKILEKLNRIP